MFKDLPECHALLLPVYAVAVFGVVSICIVLYRVLTFNNCDDAAKELTGQIKEAKAFYKKHGLNIGE